MSLALEFRPATFGDVAGQPWVSLVLEMMVTKDDVPPVMLFHGSPGTGKTSTARILAAALNCEAERRPCAQCESCTAIRTGRSVDVIEVDAATNGRVEDIRKLCDLVTYDVGSRNRVVILDEAHGLSKAAFDAFLKTLEEPPPNVTFVFCTTEPDQLPDTVLSRCLGATFRFKPVSITAITSRLRMVRDTKGLKVDDEVLAAIAERADGGLRDAIMLLDQAARADAGTAEKFYDLTGEGDFAPGLIAIMLSGRLGDLYDKVEALMYEVGDPQLIASRLVRCLRDLLVLRAGATGAVSAQGEALRVRQALASRVTEIQVVGAMRVLWDLQKIRNGNDPRMVLDLAAVMCAEQFAPVRQQASVNGNGHQKTTIEGLKALAGT